MMLGNLKEMKTRGTPLIIIGEEDDQEIKEIADVLISCSKGTFMASNPCNKL